MYRKRGRMKKNNTSKENYAIEINDVSMMFNLGIEKNSSLKQKIIDLVTHKNIKNKDDKNEFWALKNIDIKIKNYIITPCNS